MKNRTGELIETLSQLDCLCPLGNDGDCPPDNADCKKCAYTIDTAKIILKACKDKGLAFVVDRELPEIPEFNYDEKEYRPYLRRGAINYSKMLTGYKPFEEIEIAYKT